MIGGVAAEQISRKACTEVARPFESKLMYGGFGAKVPCGDDWSALAELPPSPGKGGAPTFRVDDERRTHEGGAPGRAMARDGHLSPLAVTLPLFYLSSITRSALFSTSAGTVTPMARAVFKFTINS